jgi:thiol peroxidase
VAEITFKGNKTHTGGERPSVGTMTPEFTLTGNDMVERTLADFSGKNIVFNIFVSLDTSVCAMSVRRFNSEAAGLPDTVVLCVSGDLPFAQGRFCAAEGIKDVITLSAFRYRAFANDYGVRILDGSLKGLLARAVVVVDRTGKVIYTELVPEITQEPDYDAALRAVRETEPGRSS